MVVYLTNVQVRQCGCDDAWSRFRRDQNACAVFDKVVEGSGQAAVEEFKVDTVVLLVGCSQVTAGLPIREMAAADWEIGLSTPKL